MGTIKKGILGGFSGRVGNVIGGSWKGIDYMRSEATSIANPRTAKQVEVRDAFGEICKLMSGALPMLRASDWRKYRRNSAFSHAVKVNYDNAVSSGIVTPSSLIFGDFSSPVLSDLTGVFSVQDTKQRLTLTWTLDGEDEQQHNDDTVYCVAVVKSPGLSVYGVKTFEREDEGGTWDIDAASGATIFIYVGVASSDPYQKISARNSATMLVSKIVS